MPFEVMLILAVIAVLGWMIFQRATASADYFDLERGAVAWVELDVAASTNIYSGIPVCSDVSAGGIKEAADAANLVFVGVSRQRANNSGGTLGALKCQVTPLSNLKYLVFDYASPAASLVGQRVCFSDYKTVALPSATTNDITAGRVVAIIATGATGKVLVDVTDRFALPAAA